MPGALTEKHDIVNQDSNPLLGIESCSKVDDLLHLRIFDDEK